MVLFFLKKSCLLEISQVLPVRPSGKSNTEIKMSMEYWWKYTDSEKTEVHLEKNLS
jgi:hypothetical protein